MSDLYKRIRSLQNELFKANKANHELESKLKNNLLSGDAVVKERTEEDKLIQENKELKRLLAEAHASRVMNEEGLLELNRKIKEDKTERAIELINEQIKIYDKKSEEKQTDLNSPHFYSGKASGLNDAKLILERLK